MYPPLLAQTFPPLQNDLAQIAPPPEVLPWRGVPPCRDALAEHGVGGAGAGGRRGAARGRLSSGARRHLLSWRVDVRLPGQGNSNSHGARPVHPIMAFLRCPAPSACTLSFHRMFYLNCFRKSTPPQNRQLIVYFD
jgi:hypothetical protein